MTMNISNVKNWQYDLFDMPDAYYNELLAISATASASSRSSTRHPVEELYSAFAQAASAGTVPDLPAHFDTEETGYLVGELAAIFAWGHMSGISDLNELLDKTVEYSLWEYCIIYGKKMGLYDSATNAREFDRWISGERTRSKN